MRFLVDANLAVPVAAWLRGRGHDAVHLLEAGLAGLPDSAVLAKAHAEGRVLLTCDLDFGELLADPGGPRASVVLFRVASQRLDRILPRLSRVLDECASALAAGAPSWSPTRLASGSGGCRFGRKRPRRRAPRKAAPACAAAAARSAVGVRPRGTGPPGGR